MNKYFYDGPVLEFDKLIVERWKGETIASSENKARSNLAYQFKKNNHRVARTKIKLPGKLKRVDWKDI